MLIAFVVAATFVGIFLSAIWSTERLPDLFIKMVSIMYTIWAAWILFQLLPTVQLGTMRLI